MPPQALGELMLVPFISCEPRNVQLGTEAMAPPGALIDTPRAPSMLKHKQEDMYSSSIQRKLRKRVQVRRCSHLRGVLNERFHTIVGSLAILYQKHSL